MTVWCVISVTCTLHIYVVHGTLTGNIFTYYMHVRFNQRFFPISSQSDDLAMVEF